MKTNTKVYPRKIRAAATLLGVATLQGCLLTSPYHGQEFASKTSNIPVQAWTVKKTEPVKLECTQSSRFGPAPLGGTIDWQLLNNLPVETNGVVDSFTTRVNSANITRVLPDSCWQTVETSSGTRHYTALRVTQANYQGEADYVYQGFTNSGLECLGREIGKAASWVGWIGKECVRTYSNSSAHVPYVVIVAK